MDGFHYSRTQLREMASERAKSIIASTSTSDSDLSDSLVVEKEKEEEEYKKLLARRGAPHTFDPKGES